MVHISRRYWRSCLVNRGRRSTPTPSTRPPRWDPRGPSTGRREALAGIAVVVIAVFGVVIGLHGKIAPIVYSQDDPIYPGSEKRDRNEIVRFIEVEVMPWARTTLGRIKGGPDSRDMRNVPWLRR